MTKDAEFHEMRELLALAIETDLTAEELRRIEEFILSSEEACTYYLEYMDIHGSVSQLSASFETEPVTPPSSPSLGFLAGTIDLVSRPVVFSLISAAMFTLGGLMLMGVLPAPNWRAHREADRVGEAAPHRFVAQITRTTADCQWGEAELPAFYGARLQRRQELILVQGLAEITFDDGAKLILEGPSTFTIESGGSGILDVGRLTAKVPRRAVGFVVDTPVARVIDLGTEFGLEVDPQGAANVQVFAGKVSLATEQSEGGRSPEIRLKAGEAAQVHQEGGRVSKAEVDPTRFVRQSQFKARIADHKLLTYHRWLAYSQQLRKDPDLLVYYTFEHEAKGLGRLANRAKATHAQLHGLLGDGDDPESSPTWTVGRWDQKAALRFDAKKQQVVVVDESASLDIAEGLTVSAWIQLEDPLSIGIVCSKWNDHGDLNDKFCFWAGVASIAHRSDASTYDYGSRLIASLSEDGEASGPSLQKDERRDRAHTLPHGRWDHVVFTVRPDGGLIRLYKNGHEVDRTPTVFGAPVLPATTQPVIVGGKVNRDDTSSFYDGLIDEIAIFRRVLTPREIRRMYQAGQPD